jgi:FkbM family methyltransferase
MAGHEPFRWVRRHPGVIELGSKYGRWGIEIDRVDSDTVVASFGLGEDVTFETALIERTRCRVFGFDPTPRAVGHLSERASDPRFTHIACALADREGTLTLRPPPETAADQASASAYAGYQPHAGQAMEVPCMTLEGARRAMGGLRINVLKMDIEGAEYDVIAQATANNWLDGVEQVLVEFHHFLPAIGCERTRVAIASLLRAGFDLSWIGRTNHEYLFTRARESSVSTSRVVRTVARASRRFRGRGGEGVERVRLNRRTSATRSPPTRRTARSPGGRRVPSPSETTRRAAGAWRPRPARGRRSSPAPSRPCATRCASS